MAVTSGLSDSSVVPRAGDAWKPSWPLIAGLVLFIYLMNASGQPNFLEHGIVRALAGAYVEITGPETPIYVCPC